jgi:hypothetical protein
MPTPKVNSWLGWRIFAVNISPMLKLCSSSSKPSMDIIVAHQCLNLAIDHTRENMMLSKFYSLKFHNVLAFISTDGRFLIKLIPQVLTCSQSLNRSQNFFWNKERDEEKLNQVHKFKSSCILLMNSQPACLSSLYILLHSLSSDICGRLYMELFGKV